MSLVPLFNSLASAELVPLAEGDCKIGIMARARFSDALGRNWSLSLWDRMGMPPRVTLCCIEASYAEHFLVGKMVAVATDYDVAFAWWPSDQSEPWFKHGEICANGRLNDCYIRNHFCGPKGNLP